MSQSHPSRGLRACRIGLRMSKREFRAARGIAFDLIRDYESGSLPRAAFAICLIRPVSVTPGAGLSLLLMMKQAAAPVLVVSRSFFLSESDHLGKKLV
jgi:hypothetical protein